MPQRLNHPALVLVVCLVLCFTTSAAEKEKPQSEVSITNLQYKPAQIKIHTGETVVWTNHDDRDHTVVANDGSFKSDNIKSGQSFQFTFPKAGKYPYGCSYHPRMKAMVIVE